ncbi:hypothetical protein IHE31_03830 [Mycetohabitans rhizoxinica]
MQSNANQNRNTADTMSITECRPGTGCPVLASYLRTNVVCDGRASACAAVEEAMKSVGLMLEIALEAMANLRDAKDALTRYNQ